MWCFVTVCVTGMVLRVLGYASDLLGVLAGLLDGLLDGLVVCWSGGTRVPCRNLFH